MSTIQTVWQIAEQINEDIGITPYDAYDIWRQEQIRYYQQNFTTPISRNNPPSHAWFVFDQINNAGQIQLNPFDFNFGTPQAYANAANPTYNTQVVITAAELTGYTGSATVYYNRVDLQNALSPQQGSLSLGTGTPDLYSIIDQLNTIYGLDLTQDDLVNQTLPAVTNPGPVVTVTIAASPTSLKYQGSFTYALNITGTTPVPTPGPVTYQGGYMVYSTTQAIATPADITNLVAFIAGPAAVSSNWSFARNVTSVSLFQPTAAFYNSLTQVLVLNGQFTLSYTLGQNTITGTFATLSVDATGQIISSNVTASYGLIAGYQDAVNRDPQYRYAFNPSITGVSTIVRYLPDGTVDSSFSTAPIYTPALIFSQESGNYYTVSPVYTGVNPTSSYALTQPLIRIDRYTTQGVIDSLFTPVYIAGINPNAPLVSITDILETTANVYILTNQACGYGVGANIPTVNAQPLVSASPTLTSPSVFWPIISLTLTGQLNPQFSSVVNVFSEQAFLSDPSKTTQPKRWMNFAQGVLTTYSYFPNPTTMLLGYYPFSINAFGVFVPISGQALWNLPVLGALYDIIPIDGSTEVITGELASVNMNGIQSQIKDTAYLLDASFTTTTLGTLTTGSLPQGQVSLVDFVSIS